MPETPKILERFKSYRQCAESIVPFLFHGTTELIEGELKPGNCDGVFWMADAPAVAQTYIPECGLTAYETLDAHRLTERIQPSRNSHWTQIAETICGSPADATYDEAGKLKSYALPPNWPTYSTAANYLNAELGYRIQPGEIFELKLHCRADGSFQILPYTYRLAGWLIIVERESIPTFRKPISSDGDLTDPDHMKLDLLTKLGNEQQTVTINDFCQTRAHGNVGHVAYGIFSPRALHPRWAKIPATHYEWPTDRPINELVTPDYHRSWLAHRNSAQKAA